MEFDERLLTPFANRLQKMDRHRSKLARRQELDCFRIYDFDLPEFPMAVDRYGDHLYVALYAAKGPKWLQDPQTWQQWWDACQKTLSQTLQVPESNIHEKQRRRKSESEGQYQKTDDRRQFFEVNECGLRFWVNLTDYLDTGLFLDHRETRQMVRNSSAHRRVLNLFCYTGSFSVYAADGNAATVTSVDLSNTYLNWARDNFQLNGLLDPDKHQFVKADVTTWLKRQPANSYDLVVMDPPTFSNSKSMESHLDVQRDHLELIHDVMAVMSPGGELIFSTNYRRFSFQADGLLGCSAREITRQTTPFDFQGKMARWCFRICKDQ